MKNMPSDKSSLTMIEFDHLKREGKLKNLFKAKQDLIRAKVPCKRADHRRNIPIYPFNTFKSQHRNRMKVTFPVIFGTKVSCILNAFAEKNIFITISYTIKTLCQRRKDYQKGNLHWNFIAFMQRDLLNQKMNVLKADLMKCHKASGLVQTPCNFCFKQGAAMQDLQPFMQAKVK